MQTLRTFNNALFARLTLTGQDWIIPTLARFTFAATLLWFFWYSALTKISDGFFGFLKPSFGAYAGILPWRTEPYSFLDTVIVLLGTWAELALPVLIIGGLFTRAASLAMIGFVGVMCLVDIYGHHVEAETIGTWFDGRAGSVIADQRLFWLLLLTTLVFTGGGPISMDRIFKIR
jgi:putative oxidoreductase